MKLYENGDIMTRAEYEQVGHGINAQDVFAKFVTTFSIADGIIKNREYVAPNCFYK